MPDDPDAKQAFSLAERLQGGLPLLVATYLWQAVGVGLLVAASYGADNKDMFLGSLLGGLLALVLGHTIRRCDDPSRWALPLALLATAALAIFGPLEQAVVYAFLCSAPLAMIYHGAMIGEPFLTITPYSGQRSAPVHGGCVHGVGSLALLGGTIAALYTLVA